MDQKTKICSGKHGCGEELPIEEFYFNKKQNNYQTYCKACVNKQARIWENAHKDRKAKRMHRYHQTERGKATLKRAADKYRKTPAGQEYFKTYWDRYREDLRTGYVHGILKRIGIERTPEFVDVKRSEILLHREIKTIIHGDTRRPEPSINQTQ